MYTKKMILFGFMCETPSQPHAIVSTTDLVFPTDNIDFSYSHKITKEISYS